MKDKGYEDYLYLFEGDKDDWKTKGSQKGY
jgi:hypothetical protein